MTNSFSIFKKRAAGLNVLFLLLVLGLGVSPLWADNPPASGQDDDFARFLLNHQDEVNDFYQKNSDKLNNEAYEIYENYFARILLICLSISLFLDALLGFLFSSFFSTTAATIVRAVFYSTGKLISTLLFVAAYLLLFYMFALSVGGGTAFFLIVGLSLAAPFLFLTMQIWLVKQVYRTGVLISMGFVILSTLMVGGSNILVLALLHTSKSSAVYKEYIDERVLPVVLDQSKDFQNQLDKAKTDNQILSNKAQDIESKITEEQTHLDRLKSDISTKQASDSLNLAQIATVRATGDLPKAIQAYNDFLQKYPTSLLLDQVKLQIADMTNELNAQIAEKQRLTQLKAQQDALKEANLQARIKSGTSTLSEVLVRFHFCSREQVSAVLGPPDAIGANQWGYNRAIVTNPVDGKTHGVIFNFYENKVQSVDMEP